MCGCCDGGASNWPSLPQLWFCFPFFCFLKKYAFQRVCWKLNYMHREAPVFPCGLSTQHTLVTIYWAITILQVYILLLFSCPVVSESSRPHGPTISQSLPKFMSISYSDAIQPSYLLEKHQGLFQWVNCLHQVTKVLEFSFSIIPSSEYSVVISSKIDWFDLLAVQRTRKRLLQHHSSKASILWCSAFFMVQLWQPYMTTGKTITLTRQTFVGKVMPLLFNTLSRFVIAFLPRSSCLLILWLQSPSSVILEPPPKLSLSLFPLFPHLFAMKWWDWMPWS